MSKWTSYQSEHHIKVNIISKWTPYQSEHYVKVNTVLIWTSCQYKVLTPCWYEHHCKGGLIGCTTVAQPLCNSYTTIIQYHYKITATSLQHYHNITAISSYRSIFIKIIQVSEKLQVAATIKVLHPLQHCCNTIILWLLVAATCNDCSIIILKIEKWHDFIFFIFFMTRFFLAQV